MAIDPHSLSSATLGPCRSTKHHVKLGIIALGSCDRLSCLLPQHTSMTCVAGWRTKAFRAPLRSMTPQASPTGSCSFSIGRESQMRAAMSFAERHGSVRWHDLESMLAGRPICSKLKSHWHFADCGYRKDARSCARPDILPFCPLPSVPTRKGALNQAAFSLALFVRDVCGGDIVAWIDARLCGS